MRIVPEAGSEKIAAGAHISFCSVFPHKREVVYAPGTYFKYRADSAPEHGRKTYDVTVHPAER